MKLYYHPLSTYSQKVVIAFYEKKVDFESEIVNMMDPASAKAFREVYPIGKIPFLIADDNWKIPESSVIVEYLDNNFSKGTSLIPSDKVKSRQARFHDRMIDLYLNNAIGQNFFESLKPMDQQDQELIAKNKGYADCVLNFMNEHLKDNQWMNGEDFSIADCAAAPCLAYAEDWYPFGDYPNIVKYWARLSKRPSVMKVINEAKPYMEEFMKSQQK